MQANTSGPLTFSFDYSFEQGGPVEAAILPYPERARAPFEVARWSVAPGTFNDLDTHRSREVWFIIAGSGTVTFADQVHRVQQGEAIAFDSENSAPSPQRWDHGPPRLLRVLASEFDRSRTAVNARARNVSAAAMELRSLVPAPRADAILQTYSQERTARGPEE